MFDYAPVQFAKLLSFSFLMAAGQVLFKRVSLDTPPLTDWRAVVALGTNTWFVMAITLYVIATVIWIGVLREVPLSRAYPFIALGFVLVPLAGRQFFGEPLDGRYLVGVILILIGILLTIRRV
jgi:multidrug transporter EmrE-like cation transporter